MANASANIPTKEPTVHLSKLVAAASCPSPLFPPITPSPLSPSPCPMAPELLPVLPVTIVVTAGFGGLAGPGGLGGEGGPGTGATTHAPVKLSQAPVLATVIVAGIVVVDMTTVVLGIGVGLPT